MNLVFKILFSAVFFIGLVSCESKFEEKERVGLGTDSAAKEEYNLKAEDIQGRLAKAQELIDGLAQIFKKIYSPEIAKLTVSDILVQIMDSVKSSRVEGTASGYVSEGDLYLTIPGLKKDCRHVRVRSVYMVLNASSEHSISVLTCQTGGEFRKIVDLTLDPAAGVSVLVDPEIEKVIPKVQGQQMLSAKGCKVTSLDWQIDEITCETADIRLNDQEHLKFQEISYVHWRNPVFITKAVLFKNNEPTFNFVFEVDLKGETFSKVTPVEPAPVATPVPAGSTP